MTIFVDELREYPTGKWCHMWTDGDLAELHFFAEGLGLRRNWLHRSHGKVGAFPHYDLRENKRNLAIEHGAEEKPLKEWIRQKSDHNP